MSSITILTASPKVPQTKTIVAKETGDEIQLVVRGAKMSTNWSSVEKPVSNIEGLIKIVRELKDDLYSVVIRGCVADHVDKVSHVRRKIRSGEGTIEEVDQQWICIDIDKKPIHIFGSKFQDLEKSPQKVIKKFIDELPSCFRNATCCYKISSSTGVTNKDFISVHLWFWLDQPMSNADLKHYWSLYNEHMNLLYGVEKWIDPVLYDSIQPHFTANPNLVGVEDPIKNRFGIIRSKYDVVTISKDWITVTPLDKVERWKEFLSRVGDDKDGFHSPLLSASASWVRKNGYNEKANKQFIQLVKETVLACSKSKDRSEEDINRYSSVSFINSLLRTAAEKGFDQPGAIITDDIRAFFQEYVYVEGSGKFFKKERGMFVGRDSFDLIGRKVTRKSQSSVIYVESGGPVVDKIACLPSEPPGDIVMEAGQKTYNSWPGRLVGPSDNPDGKILEDHIAYIAEEERYASVLLDYIAFVLVNPGIKVMWSPLIGSTVHGIGKSILKVLFYNIIHPSMIKEIGTKQLKSDFNEFMFDTELIFVEEIYAPDRMEITNNLKAMITEKRINVNIKHVSGFNVPNTANLFLFTNHENALYIDQYDRRFFTIFNRSSPKEEGYYINLVNEFEKRPSDFLAWAYKRDLSKFNPHKAPITTESKKIMIKHSIPVWQNKIMEHYEEITWPFQHDVMYGSEMMDGISSIIKKDIQTQNIFSFIKTLGFVQLDYRPRTKDGRRPRIWIIRNLDEHKDKTIEELLELAKPVGTKEEWKSSRNF